MKESIWDGEVNTRISELLDGLIINKDAYPTSQRLN